MKLDNLNKNNNKKKHNNKTFKKKNNNNPKLQFKKKNKQPIKNFSTKSYLTEPASALLTIARKVVSQSSQISTMNSASPGTNPANLCGTTHGHIGFTPTFGLHEPESLPDNNTICSKPITLQTTINDLPSPESPIQSLVHVPRDEGQTSGHPFTVKLSDTLNLQHPCGHVDHTSNIETQPVDILSDEMPFCVPCVPTLNRVKLAEEPHATCTVRSINNLSLTSNIHHLNPLRSSPPPFASNRHFANTTRVINTLPAVTHPVAETVNNVSEDELTSQFHNLEPENLPSLTTYLQQHEQQQQEELRATALEEQKQLEEEKQREHERAAQVEELLLMMEEEHRSAAREAEWRQTQAQLAAQEQEMQQQRAQELENRRLEELKRMVAEEAYERDRLVQVYEQKLEARLTAIAQVWFEVTTRLVRSFRKRWRHKVRLDHSEAIERALQQERRCQRTERGLMQAEELHERRRLICLEAKEQERIEIERQIERENLERLERETKQKEEIKRREREREEQERHNLENEEARQRAVEQERQRIREYQAMERERCVLAKLRQIQQRKLESIFVRITWPCQRALVFRRWQDHTKLQRSVSRIQGFWIRYRKRKDQSTLQAASALQSAFRGFHVRRKIDAALKLAKVRVGLKISTTDHQWVL